jgi:hypothetical protein
MTLTRKLLMPLVGIAVLAGLANCPSLPRKDTGWVRIDNEDVRYKEEGGILNKVASLMVTESVDSFEMGNVKIYTDYKMDRSLDAFMNVGDGNFVRNGGRTRLERALLKYPEGEYHNYLLKLGIIEKIPGQSFNL